ncbi:metallopeptidase, family M24 [Oceanicola granulosus HTCC2516]|uniref:Metallopeptidase, family M24 n=1 Tax=Oceanicola granulosus (strain ATCC BAA-861 / DSM 15982 / KCTC 12143 / HTCC2516) TaxID=314256 RepID=Q2CE97_OCEGH|nr:dimethylsulfonioproprionate lyase DddP [Oceanicola granulosus]EAR50963.1 metallopeptidase, family M24 [Oceanicola granulosus HTCC2516]
MNLHYRDSRKIDPSCAPRPGDDTPDDDDRIEIGPTRLACAEWAAAGLELPDLPAMRRYRWERLTAHVQARGLAGLLMFDPLNIRYATDSTNMQLWNSHNPFRAVLLCADGYMVIWDYRNSPFLSAFNPLVREARSGADLFYFDRGDRIDLAADSFANEVRLLLAAHGEGRRLAVDKVMLHGLRALEAQGLEVVPGEEVTEKSRAVKGPDEIRAMRCALHACEAAVARMEDFARTEVPRGGVSEDDIWAVLHAENIRRGGEWIETRLLTSGPRTNPWFQECGPRIVRENEIVAFDTDLVGAYGICSDISRSWWIGDGPARPDMVEAYRVAREHLAANMALLRPGANLPDISRAAHVLPEQYQAQKYGCLMHGVGLCDEWPLVAYPDALVEGAFDYPLEPGMTLCVEALVSAPGANFSIKLEDQVLITETGVENLTRYPFDPRLGG